MAPALMNGLRGTPFSCSSWTRELNAEPDGSRRTQCQSRRHRRAEPVQGRKPLICSGLKRAGRPCQSQIPVHRCRKSPCQSDHRGRLIGREYNRPCVRCQNRLLQHVRRSVQGYGIIMRHYAIQSKRFGGCRQKQNKPDEYCI